MTARRLPFRIGLFAAVLSACAVANSRINAAEVEQPLVRVGSKKFTEGAISLYPTSRICLFGTAGCWLAAQILLFSSPGVLGYEFS